MGNLSNREKGLVVVIVGLLIVVLFLFFGFKPLYNNVVNEKAELQNMKALEEQYNAIKESNEQKELAIREAEGMIGSLENSFLPEINTENILYFLMNTFEEQNCPYLFTWSTENVICDDIYLPDGSVANDTLLCERVTLSYSTTTGYLIPEYNRDPEWVIPAQGYDTETINAEISQMGIGEDGLLTPGNETNKTLPGYDEFINSLKVIESTFPDSIKINEIRAEDTGAGYMKLTAVIDFYAINSGNRVSQADYSAPYVSWAGADDYDTTGGLIGEPILVLNPNSSYWATQIVPAEVANAEHEYASWFSVAILRDVVGSNQPIIAIENNEFIATASTYEFGADSGSVGLDEAVAEN